MALGYASNKELITLTAIASRFLEMIMFLAAAEILDSSSWEDDDGEVRDATGLGEYGMFRPDLLIV